MVLNSDLKELFYTQANENEDSINLIYNSPRLEKSKITIRNEKVTNTSFTSPGYTKLDGERFVIVK